VVRRWIALLVVVVTLWFGLAWCAAPADAHECRRTAVQAAQAGLTAARTVALAGDAQLRDRLFDPYFATVVEDESGAVAGAQQQLAGQVPPDEGTRRMRDQLTPLLVAATQQIGDLDLALSSGDRDAATRNLAALRHTGDQLDDFVERYR
jgi:hypothetical protein